jgi:hypothetical protein
VIFYKPFNYKVLSESGPIKFKPTGHYFAKTSLISIRIWPKVSAYYLPADWGLRRVWRDAGRVSHTARSTSALDFAGSKVYSLGTIDAFELLYPTEKK